MKLFCIKQNGGLFPANETGREGLTKIKNGALVSIEIKQPRNIQHSTKHFEAGVLVMDPVPLGIKCADVPGEWFFVPSDGKRGGGSRVKRCFPVVREWSGDVTFHVLDDTITQDAFEHHLSEAGKFIGIGRFRPRNNGFYGRFSVEKVSWN